MPDMQSNPASKGKNNAIAEKIKAARGAFKPDKIKCLLVGKAPPDHLDRFFYYQDVKKHDYLFLGVAEVLYPDLKQRYISNRRPTEEKTEILHRLKSDGFFLMDILDIPISQQVGWDDALSRFLKRLEHEVSNDIPILLIGSRKRKPFDIAYRRLIEAGYKPVITEIPNPAQGNINKFKLTFAEALKSLDVTN